VYLASLSPLAGDATGGGHTWFGSLQSFWNGLSGSKSMFPAMWSNEKIMHAISYVVKQYRKQRKT